MDAARATLDRVAELYNAGLYLQAFDAGRVLGPLAGWPGTDGRILASRLAKQVGSPRLGEALALRAWRADRGHPEAICFAAYALWRVRGPFEAWRHLVRTDALHGGGSLVLARTRACAASLLTLLRDVDQAEAWMRRALDAFPEDPWLHVERALQLEILDRYAEAIEAASQALRLRPWYRPAVQCAAHLHTLLGEDAKAVALLEDGLARIESAPMAASLVDLHIELDRHPEGVRALARVEQLSPLREKSWSRWIAARKADCAYYLGDRGLALEEARKAEGLFYTTMAERLESPPAGGRRIRLGVPFVRQHRGTCAPATLSALSRYWSVPADHLGLAEEICHDGTPPHEERAWADRNGFISRQFTLDWTTAVALAERGVPFTLATVEANSAHLQALVGFDEILGTFLVRDPYERRLVDVLAGELLRRHAGTGPLAMAMVPAAEAARLDGLELPDASLHDRFHEVQTALEAHARGKAEDAVGALRAQAPLHRLTWLARRAAAIYDADATAILEANQALLDLHPESDVLRRNVLLSLRELDRRDDRIGLLEQAVLRRDAHPLFLRELVRELLPDAREHPRARSLLRLALRRAPLNATAMDPINAWARRERAMLLVRLRRADEARAEIETAARIEPLHTNTHGVRGWVLEKLGSETEARTAYAEAMRRSADNAAAVWGLLRVSTTAAERREALELVRGELARQTLFEEGILAFREAAAGIFTPDEILACLREAAAARPDLWYARTALARQLGDMGFLDEALATAKETAERFPLVAGSWMEVAAVHRARDAPEEEAAALEKTLQVNPTWSAPARRLASLHQNRRDLTAARSVLERAVAHDPLEAPNHGCLADALWRLGEREAAREAAARAIRLDLSYDWAWDAYRDWSVELGHSGAHVELARELTRRRAGDPRAWVRLAEELEGEGTSAERLAALDRAIELDPRSTEAHDLRAVVLAAERRWEDALAACRPAVWAERAPVSLRGREAWVLHQKGDRAGAIARMREAVGEDPNYGWGWRQLVNWCDDAGDAAGTLQAAGKLVEIYPRDESSWGWRARARSSSGDHEGAKEDLRRALRIEPAYRWAGSSLLRMHLASREPEEAAAVLEIFGPHIEPGERAAYAVEIATARGDAGRTLESLGACLAAPGADGSSLETALDAAAKVAGARRALAVLEEVSRSDDGSPETRALWIRRITGARPWKARRAAGRFLDDGERGERAVMAYINAQVQLGKLRPLLRWIRRHGRRLAARDRIWGCAAFGLVSCSRWRAACAWMADWRTRPGVEAWMLDNLADALREQGRHEEALAIRRHAVTLARDVSSPYHLLWLALDAAERGEEAEAREHIARASGPLDGYATHLLDLVEITLSGAADRETIVRWRRARRAFPALRGHASLRRAHAAAGWRLARAAGGLAGRLLVAAELASVLRLRDWPAALREARRRPGR